MKNGLTKNVEQLYKKEQHEENYVTEDDKKQYGNLPRTQKESK